MSVGVISASAFAELLKSQEPPQILDVREPAEHAAERLGAAHVVLSVKALDIPRLTEAFNAQKPLYLLCKAGARAEAAGRRLQGAFNSLVVIRGGLDSLKRVPGVDIRRGADAKNPAP